MENRNSELSEELRDVLKSQQNVDGTISRVNPIIQPVIDVNPKHAKIIDVVVSASSINTIGGTFFSVPKDKEFYLVGIISSIIKDATSQSVETKVTATINGVATVILSIPSLTLTAQNMSHSFMLPIPVKIDSGTNILHSNSNATANITSKHTLFGYFVTNPKA